MRRESETGRARRTLWDAVTAVAIALADGACQIRVPGVCTGRAETGHHRLPRSQGGPHTIDNCVPGCGACHRYVTDHPAWAYAHGFTLRRAEGGGRRA